MLRYMLGRNVDEEHTKTLRTRALEQRSKQVGVQTEASKVMVGGCTGLDGDMLVLRQAASRRCGRTIVDADAGCKMLSPGDGGAMVRLCTMHEADGCAAFYSSK